MSKRRKHRKHWYYITIYECVLCMRQEIYRERRYGRKPKDPSKRYEWHPDACSSHF